MVNFRIITLLLFFVFISCKQKKETNPSYNLGVSLESYDSHAVENLALLCKVWGFLKYYHPEVAGGKYDWDAELFKVMSPVAQATSVDVRNNILKDWINGLGKVKISEKEPVQESENIKMHPDLDWTEDSSALGKDVTELLSEIKNAERKDSCHYVGFVANVGNPIFKNEKAYEDMDYSDANLRLLALFRYWNIIQYYFPYRYLIDDNWHDVLMEFIPQFIDAKSELDYKLTLLKLIAKINDTHAGIRGDYSSIEKYKGLRVAPFEITFVEGKAVVTDFYKPINLNEKMQVGDVILSINNISIEFLIKERLKYTPGSNYEVQLRDIARDLLRTNDDKLFVKYERNLSLFSDSIYCPYISDMQIGNPMQKNKPLVETFDNITYLYLGSSGIVPSKIETKGLIIDLRCYPNSQKVKGYWDYLYLYPDSTAFTKFTFSSTILPGKFTFTKELKVGKPNADYYKGKKVILINELSQSHAEFMAMKYRCAPNTTVIGSTTAGADGNVSYFYLPGGVRTCITALGIYYPDGTEIQRVGIVPDIEVKPTIKGIREGRDEVLEKAIELINSKK